VERSIAGHYCLAGVPTLIALPLLTLIVACADPPAGPPNIILISVDGMRADRSSAYGGPHQTTPTLDALAAEGLRFEWAFSQSNESLFSHAAMLTGRHVSELAAPDYRTFVLPESALTAAEILGLYGYHTAAFVAGGHVRGAYGFAQGFSEYRDEHDFGAFFHTAPEALDWIEGSAREPYFLFLHGYDCHRPYHHPNVWSHAFDADYDGPVDALMARRIAPEQFYDGVLYPDFPVGRFRHPAGDPIGDPAGYGRIQRWAETSDAGVPLTAEDLAHVRAHYDGGALAADLELGRFLEGVDTRNTLVIWTSDHGEDLGDHGYYNHRALLRDSTTRVPLALWGDPLEGRSGVRGDLAQAIDLLPTMLAAAGAEQPAGLRGRDLLGDAPPPEVIFQEGVLPQLSARSTGARLDFSGVPLTFSGFDLALTMAPMDAPWFQLFLHSAETATADTVHAETTSALPEAAAQGEALRAAALEWRASLERSTHRGIPPDDPELRALLRSRGYW